MHPSSAIAAMLILIPATAVAETITVNATEFDFEPRTIVVDQGQTLTIVLENDGALSHNLHIPALDVEMTSIQTDGMTRHTFTPETAGTFAFHCAVPGHKQAGMKGTLKVQ